MAGEETELNGTEATGASEGGAAGVDDAYYVRDGKAYTGEGDPVDVPKGQTAEAGPDDEPDAAAKPVKPAEPKPAKPKQTIGDAWREYREQQKALKSREAEFENEQAQARAELEEIRAEREALKAERELARTDPRQFIRKNGHDLRALLEQDLAAADATPEQKELRETKLLVQELQETVKKLTGRNEEADTTAAFQRDVETVQHIATTVRHEEFPRLAAAVAKGTGGFAEAMVQAYNSLPKTLPAQARLDQVLESYETYLENLGVPLPQAETTRAGSKKSPSAKRAGSKHVDTETDDAGDDAGSETAPGLTNRSASQRTSPNGHSNEKQRRLNAALSMLEVK